MRHFNSKAFKIDEEIYIRSSFLHILEEPHQSKNNKNCYEYIKDGVLVIKNGKITNLLPWKEFDLNSNIKVTEYKNSLILPGFIDTHIHFPQTDNIAANHKGQLLDWLDDHTFPLEKKFIDAAYAKNVAKFFIKELLRNGTTTAMVFASIHPQSVDALFEEAEKINMSLISGKVMMDKNAPDYLIETPEQSYNECKELINKWHKKLGTRLQYALTPRFAASCSSAMFKSVKKLKNEFNDVYIQTHISENRDEIEFVKKFNKVQQYLDAYDRHNLLSSKTILAHGVWLTNTEFKRIHEKECKIAFCPTSNLFLGSGLFDYKKAKKFKIDIGLGTDVGAGTSFSLLHTLNEAYKVAKLKKYNLTVLESLYLVTLGGARVLGLDENLGNFKIGKEADFIVLDIKGATPLLERRLAHEDDILNKLFLLMMLGDDRTIQHTYVYGKLRN